MCIRDSTKQAQGYLGQEFEQRRAQKTYIARVHGQVQGDSCLLYTSDAADERSSVDLGGRRIIKKKKRLEHRAVSRLATKMRATLTTN